MFNRPIRKNLELKKIVFNLELEKHSRCFILILLFYKGGNEDSERPRELHNWLVSELELELQSLDAQSDGLPLLQADRLPAWPLHAEVTIKCKQVTGFSSLWTSTFSNFCHCKC